jgi:hypothetical protein
VTCWGIGYKFDATPAPTVGSKPPSDADWSNVTPLRRQL